MGAKKKKVLPDDIIKQNEYLEWRIHTVSLMQETLNNPGTGILKIPYKIWGYVLHEVAERASQLNDPIMNGLMCRLTMYEIADPNSPAYDEELLNKALEKYREAKKKLKKST